MTGESPARDGDPGAEPGDPPRSGFVSTPRHAPDGAAHPRKDSPTGAPDMVERLLEEAKGTATARGHERRRLPAARRSRRRTGWSGAGPDDRDPQPLGSTTTSWVASAGMEQGFREARVVGHWESVVGSTLAAHCRPEAIGEGLLVVVADSTAWATQLRLLGPTLLARVVELVGPAVVERLEVRGPVAPSWVRGPRRVKGRGPRDTYG